MEQDKTLSKRDIAILTVLMTTGMRKTALTSLDISDYDSNNNTLTVIDKEDTVHVYPINNEIKTALNNWLKVRYKFMSKNTTTDALFISNSGSRISGSTIREIVKKYTKKAIGIEYSPHKIRAGYCSILYDKTGDIEFVRRAVGHSNVTTTQRYIRTDASERDRAIDLLNGIF